MKIYEELQARGLIAQVTDEPEIRELINNGGERFYIGFDPTADSLHVGHFMALCLMKRLQMAGNKPVVLLGGGTGFIGDPSGRTYMRSMMGLETIQHNCDCFLRQIGKFIEFGEDKAILAYSLTELVHGKEEAEKAKLTAQALFIRGRFSGVFFRGDSEEGGRRLIRLLVRR